MENGVQVPEERRKKKKENGEFGYGEKKMKYYIEINIRFKFFFVVRSL